MTIRLILYQCNANTDWSVIAYTGPSTLKTESSERLHYDTNAAINCFSFFHQIGEYGFCCQN